MTDGSRVLTNPRHNPDFPTTNFANCFSLTAIGVTLKDRSGGTEWTTTPDGLVASATSDPAASTNALMKLLIQLRADARAAKDFATGAAIRNGLTAIGIALEDRAGGTEWTKS